MAGGHNREFSGEHLVSPSVIFSPQDGLAACLPPFSFGSAIAAEQI